MNDQFDKLFINIENLFYIVNSINKDSEKEVKIYVKNTLDTLYNIIKKYKNNYDKEIFYKDYQNFRLNEADKEVSLQYARRDLIYGTFMAYVAYLSDINPFLELEGIILAIYDICDAFDIDYKQF